MSLPVPSNHRLALLLRVKAVALLLGLGTVALALLAGAVPEVVAGPLPREAVPEPLRPWAGWVLAGHEGELCPFLNGGEERRCLWPGRLVLELDEHGGRFSQSWTVYAAGAAPLPGEDRRWPQGVEVDGRPAAALVSQGAPVVALAAGTHTVSGSFRWDALPESLAVPAAIGLLRVTVRGAEAPFPERDASGRLFLQRAGASRAEEDRLEIAVQRRVIDGVPLEVVTRVELSVSGKAREVLLARPLLPGCIPLALASPLPARLDPDGRLRVQVRPGTWTIEVAARHDGPVAALALPPPAGPWSSEELWAFDARPRLRQVEVGGAFAVDPQQTRLPEDWKRLPTYRLHPGEVLRLAERRRGDVPPAADHLRLRRSLWLDFDGGGFTFRDQVGGTLHGSRRLEMAPPAQLDRVVVAGSDQVVTRRPGAAAAGIEVRQGEIALSAEGRIEGRRLALPAAGWDHDFEAVSGEVDLPPGWTLFAATGVDRAPGTWLGQWTLLDLFLVLVLALAARQLWGTRWGGLTLATLALVWHEPRAPRWIWVAVLVCAALLRLLPEGRLRSFTGLLALLAAALLVLIAVPFMIVQVRQGFFPALEHPDLAVGEAGAVRGEESDEEQAPAELAGGVAANAPQSAPTAPAPNPPGGAGQQQVAQVPASESSPPPPPSPSSPPPAPAAGLAPRAKDSGRLSALGYLGSTLRGASPRMEREEDAYRRPLDAIDPNAVVTTGPGLPRWHWNQVALRWDGPVTRAERLRLVLLPPAANLLLALLRVALVSLLVVRALPFGGGLRRWLPGRAAAATALLGGLPAVWLAGVAMAGLAGGALATRAAAETPPQAVLDELRGRLLARPDCHPDCAASPRLLLEIAPGALRVRLEVGAAAPVAVPVPGGAQHWLPAEVLVDGKPAVGAALDGDGRLWVQIGPGAHEILLAGPLPPRDTVALPLPLRPHRVEVTGTGIGSWTVSGLHEDGVPDDSLQLTRAAGAAHAGPGSPPTASLPPFLAVERTLRLGLVWRVETTVRRLSPPGVPAAVEVPLLPGESVTSAGTRVEKGRVLLSLGPQAVAESWSSDLAVQPRLVLAAPRTLDWTEVWRLDAATLWHVDASGVPPIVPAGEAEAARPEWHPWPGERLELAVSRPAGVPGASLTIDRSALTVTPGARSTTATLELELRSSRGGRLTITLPTGAVLETATLGDVVQPLRQEGRKLVLPVEPGAQRVRLAWREPRGVSLLFRTPAVHLGAPSVNALDLVDMPASRWVLLTGGPRLGPAVLFWALLLVLLLVAAALGRRGHTPLRARDWFLLGAGLSQIPAVAAGLVMAWLLALGWRRCKGTAVRRAAVFDLVQLLLVAWTLLALGLLFWAIHQGLLGAPEMQVAGNASTAARLRWFADRSGPALPQAWALSLPILWYRLAMLGWALWLAKAILGWLRWGWESLTSGGGWRRLRRSSPPAPPTPPISAPPPATP